jgi:hypothetical protein
VNGRLLRLGVLFLFFGFLVNPLLHYGHSLSFRGYQPLNFLVYYRDVYLGRGEIPLDWSGPAWPQMNFGHLGYLEHLLIYSLGFAVMRGNSGSVFLSRDPTRKVPGDLAMVVATLVLAALSEIVRLWYPVDRWREFLGFIQLAWADVPLDLGFFVTGASIYRFN